MSDRHPVERLRFRVAHTQAGLTLLAFLKECCHDCGSARAIKRAIEANGCRVNGRIERFSTHPLQAQAVVEFSPAMCRRRTGVPERASILYDDAQILICNKPAGVACTKGELDRLIGGRFELVHRLDKETTGALMLAKDRGTRDQLKVLFSQQQVKKEYLAIVDGLMARQNGRVENCLGRRGSFHGQTLYGSVMAERGQRAITEWECLCRGERASLLLCRPLTGRTHQVRVHLAQIGHPVLGDAQYGRGMSAAYLPARHLLHAHRLALPAPWLAAEVTAPMPADFEEAMRALCLRF